MKKYIITLFLFLSTFVAKAQFAIDYSAGYATYKMSDLKNLMNDALSSIQSSVPNIPFKLVDNFPGYLTHNVNLAYNLKQHEFGLKFSYLTTGGKLAYGDYSGEYMEKLTTNGFRIAPVYRYYLPLDSKNPENKFSFFGEISLGVVFSKLKYEGHMTIGDKTQNLSDKISGKATGLSINPLVGAKYNITPQIGILICCGYDYTPTSKISNKEQQSGNEDRITPKVDWSGFRANAGLSFTFR